MARARCPRSSVEAGQKCVEIKGAKIEQHSSPLRKIGVCLHQLLNLRNESLLSTRRVDAYDRRKDLNDAEMDTLTKSRSLTIVITADGEVQTHEKHASRIGTFCDENGFSHEWINGQKPHH